MLWGKANSISFCSITVRTPKLGEIMNWLKPVIAVRWRKPSIMKMAAFPTFQIARGGVASEGRNRGLMWLQGELRVSQLEDQNWLERGAWSSSSRLLISGWTTDMQASLSRSNPRSFWGYTSNLITIKFPGFYPKPTLVNALWCFAGLVSHTVSIFEHTLLCIKGQSILHVKKGSDSEYFWLRGSHTVSVAPPKLSCCVPKAVTENI